MTRAKTVSPWMLVASLTVALIACCGGGAAEAADSTAGTRRALFPVSKVAGEATRCFGRGSSTWAATVYARARGRGCDHPHAIRILARAWVRVLWRCWHDGTHYDVTRHRAAQALA